MSTPTDDDWIRHLRASIPPLYGYVSRRAGGDRELAEDVTQETWLRAIEEWRRKSIPGETLPWLKRVARNLLVNHYRRRQPRTVAPETLDLEEAKLAPATPEAAAVLHWGLAHLGDKQAHLLEAFHLDGKGVAAIAGELGLTERAVEGRLRRSRLALQRHLARFYERNES